MFASLGLSSELIPESWWRIFESGGGAFAAGFHDVGEFDAGDQIRQLICPPRRRQERWAVSISLNDMTIPVW
jgi:hypothetical protein